MTFGVRPDRGREKLGGRAAEEALRTPLRSRSLSTGLRRSSERIATQTGVIAEARIVPCSQKFETTIAAMSSVCTDKPCFGSRTSVLGGSTDVRGTATPSEANGPVERLCELLLDSVDSPLQAVDLGHVAELREEVLEPLEVVVQAAPAHVDHGNVVVLDGARLGFTDAGRSHQQVRDLGLGAAVAKVGRVHPDAAVPERRRQDEHVGTGLREDRLAPNGHAVQTQLAVDGLPCHDPKVPAPRPRQKTPLAHLGANGHMYEPARSRVERRPGSTRRGRTSLPGRASSTPRTRPGSTSWLCQAASRGARSRPWPGPGPAARAGWRRSPTRRSPSRPRPRPRPRPDARPGG